MRVFGAATLEGTSQRSPRPENVKGDFFVDHTCIDCDTCPLDSAGRFQARGRPDSCCGTAPEREEEKVLSMQALLSCPTCALLLPTCIVQV